MLKGQIAPQHLVRWAQSPVSTSKRCRKSTLFMHSILTSLVLTKTTNEIFPNKTNSDNKHFDILFHYFVVLQQIYNKLTAVFIFTVVFFSFCTDCTILFSFILILFPFSFFLSFFIFVLFSNIISFFNYPVLLIVIYATLNFDRFVDSTRFWSFQLIKKRKNWTEKLLDIKYFLAFL